MTPAELTARVNGLLALLDEPEGTVRVLTRADAIFGREAVVYRPDGKPHLLFTSAMGEDDEGACDLAWAKIRAEVHRHFDAACSRLGRAQRGIAAAQREVAEARAALDVAGALRRAL